MKYTMEQIIAEVKPVLKNNNCSGKIRLERKGKSKVMIFTDGDYYGTYSMVTHGFTD